jgi:hypothetical protein
LTDLTIETVAVALDIPATQPPPTGPKASIVLAVETVPGALAIPAPEPPVPGPKATAVLAGNASVEIGYAG